MSYGITAASARRMVARQEFVSLTPGPYFDVVDVKTGLPVLTFEIEGEDSPRGRHLGERAAAALAREFEQPNVYKVVKRKTA